MFLSDDVFSVMSRCLVLYRGGFQHTGGISKQRTYLLMSPPEKVLPKICMCYNTNAGKSESESGLASEASQSERTD